MKAIKIIKSIVVILIIQFAPFLSFAQNYFQLNNLLGTHVEQQTLDSLEYYSAKVVDLIENIEDAGEFKVFDYSFYINEESFERDASYAFDYAKAKASSLSSQYLLFGRQIDLDKGKLKFWIDFKFNTEEYSCLDQEAIKNALQMLTDAFVEDSQYPLLDAFVLEKKLLIDLESRLEEGFCCSGYFGSDEEGRPEMESRTNSVCLDWDKIDSLTDLIQGENYLLVIKAIKTISEFIENCNADNWRSESENGIIPRCVWINQPESIPPYSIADLAFYCGGTDALYDEIKGFVELVLSIPDLLEGYSDLVYSYTVYYAICNKGTKISKLEYYELIQTVKDLPVTAWKNPENKDIFDEIYDYFFEGVKKIGEIIIPPDCEKMEKIRASVEYIAGMITEKQTYVDMFNDIICAGEELWYKVDGFGNEERYWHGYYGVKTALLYFAVKDIPKAAQELASSVKSIITKATTTSKVEFLRLFELDLRDNLFAKIKKKPWFKNMTREAQAEMGLDMSTGRLNYNILKRIDEGGLGKAWEKINAGGIDDFICQPGYIETLEKVAKYQEEALAGSAGNVKHYRVQGGQGTTSSKNLLTVETNGNLTFNETSCDLYLSTDTREHADYFINCCRPGGKIIEFEVPKSFDIQMKEAAIPQYKARQNLLNTNGTAPKIVDPLQPGDPFALPQFWHKLLEQKYIKGTAKIIN